MSRGRFKDIEAWPEPDRTMWQRALSPASLLDDTGHALKLRPATLCIRSRAYASYLHWLDMTGQLLATDDPNKRVTSDRLYAYCSDLERSKLKHTTIRLRVINLGCAMQLLVPGKDVSFVWQRGSRYSKHGDALAKRARMQEPAVLLQLGLDLMAEAERNGPCTRRDAVLYRDGLLICVLASRAMRLRNLTAVEIGEHLQERNSRWSLMFSEAETKNHRIWSNNWPEFLLPQLLKYLEVHRRILMDGRYEGNHFWISQRPGPLTDNGIYYAVTTRTKAAFGASVNPHLFRDAVATSIAVHDPSNVGINRHLLGHSSYGTSEQYYNQARCLDASANLNLAIEKRRARS